MGLVYGRRVSGGVIGPFAVPHPPSAHPLAGCDSPPLMPSRIAWPPASGVRLCGRDPALEAWRWTLPGSLGLSRIRGLAARRAVALGVPHFPDELGALRLACFDTALLHAASVAHGSGACACARLGLKD